MQEYLSMFYEIIFGFLALLVLAKILGKTQISQITAFDFISALILGELVGNALFDREAGVPEIAFVIVLWGGLIYITEIITQKYKGTRGILEGKPAIVVYRGKLIRDVMKENKLDINQLQHLLRAKEIFSLREVEFAVLETDGTVSVLRKSAYQTPTIKDMQLQEQDISLSSTLVNDGEIIYDNLREKNLTDEWLTEKLREQGFSSVKEVFYAEYRKGENLLAMPYINKGNEPWD
ncbi:DUF421 domain-containing protein [Lentibacillus sediminis]|uniref:DUF421 domain-containing protein n=1 Tax=Lentibacillus sediminis TaxID=1940529 RepID=UPI000C1C7D2C|nr:DUF421 domain-containing protein [Lentibacillus sediminis]